jgi:glycosyltransferase involved in cell wall biosynthesis
MNISAIIITYNESHNIADAIASAAFADEIVVFDNASADNTVEIARSLGAKVILSDRNLGYSEAKSRALEHCRNRWIFWLDADERITPALVNEINSLTTPENYAAYSIPRSSYFLGKNIKHCGWSPDYVTRLFDRDKAHFSTDLVHEKLMVDGNIHKLTSPLLHYTDPTLDHYLAKLNRYTSLAATQLRQNDRKFRLRDIVFHPPATFIKMYIFRLGFLDGVEGFLLCALSAFYVLCKYAKVKFG